MNNSVIGRTTTYIGDEIPGLKGQQVRIFGVMRGALLPGTDVDADNYRLLRARGHRCQVKPSDAVSRDRRSRGKLRETATWQVACPLVGDRGARRDREGRGSYLSG